MIGIPLKGRGLRMLARPLRRLPFRPAEPKSGDRRCLFAAEHKFGHARVTTNSCGLGIHRTAREGSSWTALACRRPRPAPRLVPAGDQLHCSKLFSRKRLDQILIRTNFPTHSRLQRPVCRPGLFRTLRPWRFHGSCPRTARSQRPRIPTLPTPLRARTRR